MEGLVAGYHFDDGGGTMVRDFSGHGHDGMLHGNLSWVPGRGTAESTHASAVQFDGAHFAILQPSPKFTSGDFSISLWFKPERTGNWACPFIRGFGYREQKGDIGMKLNRDSGNLDFQVRTSENQWLFGWDIPESKLRSPVRYGQWNHVVVTRCGDTYTMWMNGTEVASEESSADISDAENTNPFIVGAFMGEGPWGDFYRGALDDFRTFRRCLSDKEIGTLYDCNGDETSLQGEGRVKIGTLIASHMEEKVPMIYLPFTGEKRSGGPIAPSRLEKVPMIYLPSTEEKRSGGPINLGRLEVAQAQYNMYKAKAKDETEIRRAIAAAEIAKREYEYNEKANEANPGSVPKEQLSLLSLRCKEADIAVEKAKAEQLFAANFAEVAKANVDIARDKAADLPTVTADTAKGLRLKGTAAAMSPPGKPTVTIVVEDLALQMIVAIREKNDKKLQTFASDRIKGWPAALPVFAVELREHYRQSTGNERFDLRAGESLVEDDLAAVRCTGPKELQGKCLVLFFVKSGGHWLNYSLRASMENVPLAEHLANLKKEIRKAAGKT